MAVALKAAETEAFRTVLLDLRARLKGDLAGMSDETLNRDRPDASGNLANVPTPSADIGTETYDQEFTLSLIENEQETLERIRQALARIEAGTFGRCEECAGPIGKPRLQAIPYTPYCIACARKFETERR